jgi:membrane protein YqaA with SNARE-associated domain
LPGIGLPALFVVSLLAATILPLGSEPVLLGYLSVAPEMFWAAIGLATFGNTLGGMVSYAMGAGAQGLFGRWRQRQLHRGPKSANEDDFKLGSASTLTPARVKAELWVQRFGAPVLLLAWLPVIGDPLCAVAGWLRLPLWQSIFYMAIGKFGRYLVLAWAFNWAIAPV